MVEFSPDECHRTLLMKFNIASGNGLVPSHTYSYVTIVPFHNVCSSSGQQFEQHKLAHRL